MALEHKFPRTPHLLWLSKQPLRDDKLMPPHEVDVVLEGDLVVEEKVDGANLGISLAEDGNLQFQNRGSYLSGSMGGQFGPLRDWAAQRSWPLRENLDLNHILFGEWCYARHSVSYKFLPDWLIGFDVYDKTRRVFWSTTQRNLLMKTLSIEPVHELARGRFSRGDLLELLRTPSSYSDQPMEGVYLRWETDEQLVGRAKLVNPDFVANIAVHWSQQKLERNGLSPSHVDSP